MHGQSCTAKGAADITYFFESTAKDALESGEKMGAEDDEVDAVTGFIWRWLPLARAATGGGEGTSARTSSSGSENSSIVGIAEALIGVAAVADDKVEYCDMSQTMRYVNRSMLVVIARCQTSNDFQVSAFSSKRSSVVHVAFHRTRSRPRAACQAV